MKKIVLTAAATLALGVAACSPANNEAGNNATDVNATEIETGNDIDNAAIDVNTAAAASPRPAIAVAMVRKISVLSSRSRCERTNR